MDAGSQSFSRQVFLTASTLLLFLALLFFIPLPGFVLVLNGMFIGAMASIFLAFGNLILESFLGNAKLGRVQQMSIGIGYLWLGFFSLVVGSTYLNIFDLPTSFTYIGAFGRYYGIIAATYMVTAPDYGLGIFYGRDRRLLWVSLIVGAIVGAIIVWLQVEPIADWKAFL